VSGGLDFDISGKCKDCSYLGGREGGKGRPKDQRQGGRVDPGRARIDPVAEEGEV